MSFTTDVKDELSRIPAQCSHCNRALLSALIRIEGTLHLAGAGAYRLEVATDSIFVARLIIKLVHELCQLKTEFTVRQSVLHKTQNYLIVIPSQPGLAANLCELGIINEEGGMEFGIRDSLISKLLDWDGISDQDRKGGER